MDFLNSRRSHGFTSQIQARVHLHVGLAENSWPGRSVQPGMSAGTGISTGCSFPSIFHDNFTRTVCL